MDISKLVKQSCCFPIVQQIVGSALVVTHLAKAVQLLAQLTLAQFPKARGSLTPNYWAWQQAQKQREAAIAKALSGRVREFHAAEKKASASTTLTNIAYYQCSSKETQYYLNDLCGHRYAALQRQLLQPHHNWHSNSMLWPRYADYYRIGVQQNERLCDQKPHFEKCLAHSQDQLTAAETQKQEALRDLKATTEKIERLKSLLTPKEKQKVKQDRFIAGLSKEAFLGLKSLIFVLPIAGTLYALKKLEKRRIFLLDKEIAPLITR